MHILLVTPYFAPENTIAAVRLTKFAEHWSEAGHEVVVLTRRVADQGGLRAPSDVDVVRASDPTAQVHRATVGGRYDEGRGRGVVAIVRRSVGWLARRFSPWPDRFVLWTVSARRSALSKPDVIVASGGPLSSLQLGSALARRFGVPWVADYRDLLSTGDYLRRSALRRRVERVMERRAVRTAAALLAVSEPMCDHLGDWLGRPATLVLNGYDPDDYPDPTPNDDGRLRILYCGEIYRGKRDPGPLFAAIALLPSHLREQVVADFFGASVDQVEELAAQYGVEKQVRTFSRVTYREALGLQRGADALLSLLWNDPREGGVYSGKLFEYIGAGRPIIALGWDEGVAATMVRERDLGIASNDHERLASFLSGLLARKRSGRLVAWTQSASVEDLSRREQSQKALAVLESVTGENRHSSRRPRRQVNQRP